MAYQINKTDGSIFANIQDGTINTDSSQIILGENYEGYGEFIGENFIHLLENGTNSTPPPNPLKGQLWFDTTSVKLKVFDGNVFKELSGLTADTTEPLIPEVGDLWFDPLDEKLYAYTGTEFILIGPGTGGGLDVDNGAIGNIIIDTVGNPHNVVELTVDTIIVAMISNDLEFTPDVAITGFATVKPGIQMSTAPVPGSSVASLFEGTARRALTLVDINGNELNFVDVAGDTMTGSLILNGDPTVNLQAATKQYVDNNSASDPNKVDVAGDTMTGPLILSTAIPINNLEAATKQYVDSSSGGGSSEFTPGTRMMFAQVSAPINWTQDTTVDNHMLRMIADNSGYVTGGTNSPIASHTHSVSSHSHSVNGHTHSTSSHSHSTTAHTHSIPSHSHTVNSHSHTTAGHTLTEAEMPSHIHKIDIAKDLDGSVAGADVHTIGPTGVNPTKFNSDSTGGSGSHSHGNTGSATSATNSVSATSGSAGNSNTSAVSAGNTGTTYGSTSSSGSGNTGTSFVPKYINILMAIKS